MKIGAVLMFNKILKVRDSSMWDWIMWPFIYCCTLKVYKIYKNPVKASFSTVVVRVLIEKLYFWFQKQALIGLLKVIGIEMILDDIHTGEILEPVQRRIKNVSK